VKKVLLDRTLLLCAAGAVILLASVAVYGADGSPDPEKLLATLREARAADTVYRNALYLYLRLAGIVWVAAEWIAAVLVWRGYRLLAAAARDGKGSV
jgi:hypothetical protein